MIKGRKFEVTHVKVRSTQSNSHSLGYCASGRLVKTEKLADKIPGLYKAISDSAGKFNYVAYLTGDYLDERVTNERIDFSIAEKTDNLFNNSDISYAEIRNGVFPLVRVFLGDSIEETLKEGKQRISEFVSYRKPRYRPLLNHIPPEKLYVDPKISDEDLDLLLNKATFEVGENILKEGYSLLNGNYDFQDYEDRLEKYLEKVTDLKQSDLANYVAHRRVAIDLLEFAIKQQSDGNFVREDVIHDLIVPMRTTSTDVEYQRQNLWLLDERLAFHNFLASDKPLSSNPTTADDSLKKPDIASVRVWDTPLFMSEQQQQASLTVVEIKRPMRNDFVAGKDEEDDPVLQSLDYLRRLREGAATVEGRLIPNAERIPGFIYVLSDFTDKLVRCCQIHQLQKTSDGMGYFGYNRDVVFNAYIQVISYDGLVASAKERHRAFFDTLGLPA